MAKTTTGALSPNDDLEARQKAREKVIAQRMKPLGIDISAAEIGKFSTVEFIPTGVPEVDKLLTSEHGVGVPTDIIIEIAGKTGSGKTTLAMKMIAEHNKRGRRAMLLDVENSFYRPRAIELGVDVDNPDLFERYKGVGVGEVWANWAIDSIKSGDYGIIVIDSVKLMTPSKEFQKSMGEARQTMAHPVFMQDFLAKMHPWVQKHHTTLVLINHIMTKSGPVQNTFTEGTSGGKIIEYLTGQRIWLTQINGAAGRILGEIEGNPVRIGGRSKIYIEKQRYGVPYQEGVMDILFMKHQGNPIAEFIYRAIDPRNEYVTRTGRKPDYTFRFMDKLTGEVLAESTTDYGMIEALVTCPPPSKLTRGDKSETGFEYICGRLKINNDQQDAILSKLLAIKTGEFTPTVLEEENPYEEITTDTEVE